MSEKLHPILPLRDVVLFPGTKMPLLVGRPKSLRAITASTELLLVAQKAARREDVGEDDLYRIGTLGRVVEQAAAGAAVKLLVEGLRRARLVRVVPNENYLEGTIELLDDPVGDSGEVSRISDEVLARARNFIDRHSIDKATEWLKSPEVDTKVAKLQALLEADLPTLDERLRQLQDVLR